MTAIDNWIAELQAERYSLAGQNLRSKIDTAVAALQQIETGLNPSGVQSANNVFAGPVSGSPANPAFRLLVAADIPAAFPQQSTGTWTPLDNSGAGLVFTGVNAGYTKIGNMVFAYARLTYPSTVSGATAALTGLPFAAANQTYARQGYVSVTNSSLLAEIYAIENSTNIGLAAALNANITNAQISTDVVVFNLIYPVT